MELRSTATTLVLAMTLALALVAPRDGGATTLAGGEHLNPGEKAHEFYLGFPQLGYQWDFQSTGKRTLGLHVGAIVWPFTIHVGLSSRTLLGIHGRSVVSFRFEPGLYVGLYGGSRGIYVNMRWGRSRSLQPTLGPVINLGVSASVDMRNSWSLILGFESPVVAWLRLSPFGWWVEWPILFDIGAEWDVSVRSTMFLKGAVGPVLGFAGDSQLAGVSVFVQLGLQSNY